MFSPETETRFIRQLLVKADQRKKYGWEMHHGEQKNSKIFSDLRRARCAPQVLFFCTPTFQIKVTPLLSNKSVVADGQQWSVVFSPSLGRRTVRSCRRRAAAEALSRRCLAVNEAPLHHHPEAPWHPAHSTVSTTCRVKSTINVTIKNVKTHFTRDST